MAMVAAPEAAFAVRLAAIVIVVVVIPTIIVVVLVVVDVVRIVIGAPRRVFSRLVFALLLLLLVFSVRFGMIP